MQFVALRLVVAWSVAFASQPQTRCAFDIGSGGIRVAASPTGVMPAEQVNLPIKKTVKDGVMPEETITQVEAQLKAYKAKCVAAGATQFVGVATSGFRAASKNGKDAIAKLNTATQIALRIATPDEESQLGFNAAAAALGPKASAHLVVWDLGGGSMQFSARAGKEFVTFLVDKGASSFAEDLVCPKIGRKLDAFFPATRADLATSEKLASGLFNGMQTSKVFAIAQKKDAVVAGLGGVHQDLGGKLGDRTHTPFFYTRAAVEKELAKLPGKDRQTVIQENPGNAFPDNYATSLALLKAGMKALRVSKIAPLKVNLADGLLATPSEWTPAK